MTLPNIDNLRRALPLPPDLVALMNAGKWVHPGREALYACAPFIQDPLLVLPTLDSMLFNSGPLMSPAAVENELFHEYRGSAVPPRALPWIDVEKTIFIMCNEQIGDDCGIALDYRPGVSNPQVVGSDWLSSGKGVKYRLIADSFTEFATLIGLALTNPRNRKS